MRIVRSKTVLLMALSVAPLMTAAQELPVLSATKFTDIPQEAALISAPNWLRGLHYTASLSERQPRLLTFLPDPFAGGVICVEATTIDGRYATTAEYDAPITMAGRAVELDYPTDFPEIWSQVSLGNSGVVVSIGGCDDAPGSAQNDLVLPSILNGQGGADRNTAGDLTLHINIHARNTQEVVAALIIQTDAYPVACKRVEQLDAIAFNFSCQATISPEATGMATFSYKRLNNGRERKGPTAQLHLPSFK